MLPRLYIHASSHRGQRHAGSFEWNTIKAHMAKSFSKPLYNSAAWQSCKQAYIQKRIQIDGGLCENCKARAGYIVHHKVLIDESNVNDPNITLNHDNLQFVCKRCHDRFPNHFVRTTNREVRYKFDEFGRPYIPDS